MFFKLLIFTSLIGVYLALQCLPYYDLRAFNSGLFKPTGIDAKVKCAPNVTHCACLSGTYKTKYFYAFDCEDTVANLVTNTLQGSDSKLNNVIKFSCADQNYLNNNETIGELNYAYSCTYDRSNCEKNIDHHDIPATTTPRSDGNSHSTHSFILSFMILPIIYITLN